MKGNVRRILIGSGLVAIWATALAFGMHSAMRYETTPGRAVSRAPELPPDSSREWTCIMVAHPLCPCTKSSLTALKLVMVEHSSEIACRIVFAGERPEETSANMEIAAEIPGATVEWASAEEAEQKYHAYTSGQVLVYRRSGTLAFSGGVTPGRGVDQPKYAIKLFDSILEGTLKRSESAVFGCALGNPSQ